MLVLSYIRLAEYFLDIDLDLLYRRSCLAWSRNFTFAKKKKSQWAVVYVISVLRLPSWERACIKCKAADTPPRLR